MDFKEFKARVVGGVEIRSQGECGLDSALKVAHEKYLENREKIITIEPEDGRTPEGLLERFDETWKDETILRKFVVQEFDCLIAEMRKIREEALLKLLNETYGNDYVETIEKHLDQK